MMCGDIIQEMLCKLCNSEFEPSHFNEKLCSKNCKLEAKRIRIKKYKDSEKGRISNEKWVKSERRKQNEYRYRQKPEAKRKAVERQSRYLKEKPQAQAYKKRIDSIYIRRTQGRLRGWWKEQLEKQDGHCAICESEEKLGTDHIIPISKGGTDDIENLQILCHKCNAIKSNHLPHEMPEM